MARVDVSLIAVIDVEEMLRRLDDAERAVLTRHQRRALAFVRGKWKGWEYKGRAKRAPINVSQKAWTATVQSTERPFRLELVNEARAFESLGEGRYNVPTPGGPGDGYTAYVHRAGSTRLEQDVLAEALASDYLPQLRADLLAEIKRSLGNTKPKRLRRGTAGPRRVGRAIA